MILSNQANRALVVGCLLALAVTPSQAAAKRHHVCNTCEDTGSVTVTCETCKGTKYVWTCTKRENARPSPNPANRGKYCGYGSSYKPLHVNCRNSRKRINCPDCARSSSASTGKVTVPCPDCDGAGHLVREYFIVLNPKEVANPAVRAQLLQTFEKGDRPKGERYVVIRRHTEESLSDFKIVHPKCRIFDSPDALVGFLRDGDAKDAGKWYFVVRNAKNVTLGDKRVALEEVAQGNQATPNQNVYRRCLTDEDVLDFKALNPDGLLFRDLDEFKRFVREVKTAAPPPAAQPQPQAHPQNKPPARSADAGRGTEDVEQIVANEMRYDEQMREQKRMRQ